MLTCSECFGPMRPAPGQIKLTCSVNCRVRRSRRIQKERNEQFRDDVRDILARAAAANDGWEARDIAEDGLSRLGLTDD
ncbi:hypothetical protein [Blastococcus tunisiensis]|uniref:Uncharacterized protein n=1 Tax=Blastococcus tunisiensis TaxID=1798228 RepID=A0A1I2JG76_9ACTN|nr:hypothetical protein [Blastococcus sp. DSM 46838]SFF52990.1 hypothetical protein SAMN05216574_1168 [Blastococcus sp. DSM 46838]